MTESELEAFAVKHIYYEIWMLLESCRERMENSTRYNRVVNNALHNSFAMHARNLDDFLSSVSGGVRSKDEYGVTINWQEPVWRKQINRKVAHLLRNRKSGDDVSDAIDMPAIIHDIGIGLLKFYDALPSDRKTWFEVIPTTFRPKEDS